MLVITIDDMFHILVFSSLQYPNRHAWSHTTTTSRTGVVAIVGCPRRGEWNGIHLSVVDQNVEWSCWIARKCVFWFTVNGGFSAWAPQNIGGLNHQYHQGYKKKCAAPHMYLIHMGIAHTLYIFQIKILKPTPRINMAPHSNWPNFVQMNVLKSLIISCPWSHQIERLVLVPQHGS